MGANAATKSHKVFKRILEKMYWSIEMVCAAATRVRVEKCKEENFKLY